MMGTPLAVQWLRLCLPMQGVRVRSLIGELRSHRPRVQRSNIVTYSIETSKMVHIKKKIIKKKPITHTTSK